MSPVLSRLHHHMVNSGYTYNHLYLDTHSVFHFQYSIQGAGGPRGATLCSRSGRAASEEITLIQGKEQQLCFAGASVKRYLTSKIRETQVRW